MNKKLLIALAAAILLATAVSCAENDPPKDTETEGSSRNPQESYITVVGTDESGNVVTSIDPVVTTPEPETSFDPTEQNPVFTEIEKKLVIITAVATIRSETVVNETTGVAWPKEGSIFDATGESENWYRISYDGETRYIAKTVVGDAAALEGFTAVNEQITISTGNEGGAVNVRSYPSTASSSSIRGTLKEGAVVTRVGVGEKWSKILFEVVSETETGADGQAVKVTKEYYISNDCIKADEATAATTEPTSETAAANKE